MNLIENASVYLIGKQVTNAQELDRFLLDHQAAGWHSDSEVGAEVVSEVGGRVCYMSFAKPRPGGNFTYLKHIKETGHGSVLEHGVWNLLLTGISRSLTHELVRHRAGFGYSQLSQRYVDESVCEVVVPWHLRNEVAAARKYLASLYPSHNRDYNMEDISFALSGVKPPDVLAGLVWLRSCKQTSEDYQFLSGYLFDRDMQPKIDANEHVDRTKIRKDARGTARSVLPNATETKIFVTANCRALRHFLEQRGSAFAEVEIRRLAYTVWKVLVKDAPNLFGDYTATSLPDGTFELTTPYKKV